MGREEAHSAVGRQLEAAEFRARVRSRDGATEVALHGELDVSSVPLLVAAIRPLLELEGLTVELDASELHFLDATGIGCVVRIRYVLRSRGGDLVIRHASPFARRLLELCGLSDLLVAGERGPERAVAEQVGGRREGDGAAVALTSERALGPTRSLDAHPGMQPAMSTARPLTGIDPGPTMRARQARIARRPPLEWRGHGAPRRPAAIPTTAAGSGAAARG